jgi:hypothetical protein
MIIDCNFFIAQFLSKVFTWDSARLAHHGSFVEERHTVMDTSPSEMQKQRYFVAFVTPHSSPLCPNANPLWICGVQEAPWEGQCNYFRG